MSGFACTTEMEPAFGFHVNYEIQDAHFLKVNTNLLPPALCTKLYQGFKKNYYFNGEVFSVKEYKHCVT